jgi:ribosomal small subunit protein bTHX
MGKGDIKTKKGKIKAGSYGISRPRKTVAPIVVAKPKAKKAVAKKPAVKKAAPAKKVAAKKAE